MSPENPETDKNGNSHPHDFYIVELEIKRPFQQDIICNYWISRSI
jgi:hypothetical protein